MKRLRLISCNEAGVEGHARRLRAAGYKVASAMLATGARLLRDSERGRLTPWSSTSTGAPLTAERSRWR
jgi:hypothetical protein